MSEPIEIKLNITPLTERLDTINIKSELTYALKCQFDLPLESWEVRRHK